MLLKPDSKRPLLKCLFCKQLLDVTSDQPRKYCGQKCRSAAYLERKERKLSWNKDILKGHKQRTLEIKRLTKLRDRLVISAGRVQSRLLEVNSRLKELDQ